MILSQEKVQIQALLLIILLIMLDFQYHYLSVRLVIIAQTG
jgi:hypothetical protein